MLFQMKFFRWPVLVIIGVLASVDFSSVIGQNNKTGDVDQES